MLVAGAVIVIVAGAAIVILAGAVTLIEASAIIMIPARRGQFRRACPQLYILRTNFGFCSLRAKYSPLLYIPADIRPKNDHSVHK